MKNKNNKKLKFIIFPIVCLVFICTFTLGLIRPTFALSSSPIQETSYIPYGYNPTEIPDGTYEYYLGRSWPSVSFSVQYDSNDYFYNVDVARVMPFYWPIPQNPLWSIENKIQSSSSYGLTRSYTETYTCTSQDISSNLAYYRILYDFGYYLTDEVQFYISNFDFDNSYLRTGSQIEFHTNESDVENLITGLTFDFVYYKNVTDSSTSAVDSFHETIVLNSSTDESWQNLFDFDMIEWSDYIQLYVADNSLTTDIYISDCFITFQLAERTRYISINNFAYGLFYDDVIDSPTAVGATILPTFSSFAEFANQFLNRSVVDFDNISYTDWLVNSVGAFMNAEILPNFALGGILAVIIAFPLVIYFLKLVLGG